MRCAVIAEAINSNFQETTTLHSFRLLQLTSPNSLFFFSFSANSLPLTQYLVLRLLITNQFRLIVSNAVSSTFNLLFLCFWYATFSFFFILDYLGLLLLLYASFTNWESVHFCYQHFIFQISHSWLGCN